MQLARPPERFVRQQSKVTEMEARLATDVTALKEPATVWISATMKDSGVK